MFNITFYKYAGENKTLAEHLATFDMYAILNNKSENAVECHFLVVNGPGQITFDSSNLSEIDNKIDISIGSLKSTDREFNSIFTYKIPDEELTLP